MLSARGLLTTRGQLLQGRAPYLVEAAELAQELLRRALPDARDFQQLGSDRALAAAPAVEGDRKAVGLVADLLDHAQNRIEAVQADRIVLLAEDVDRFLALGDGGQRLGDGPEFFERFGPRRATGLTRRPPAPARGTACPPSLRRL